MERDRARAREPEERTHERGCEPANRAKAGTGHRRTPALLGDAQQAPRKRDAGGHVAAGCTDFPRRADVDRAHEALPLEAVAPQDLDDLAFAAPQLEIDVRTDLGRLLREEAT